MHTLHIPIAASLSLLVSLVGSTSAQEAKQTTAPTQTAPANRAIETETKETPNPLFEKFERLLTGAKLLGQFTVDGKPLTDLQQESYTIERVEKQDEGDFWLITARIQYGKRDVTIPVPLQVKWAGTTPVITLDNLTIPGFGTFAARVVFHQDKYAGTWQHDDVGGHLFGRVEMTDAKPTTDSSRGDN